MGKRSHVSPKDVLDLANKAIINARIQSGNLILNKNDGSDINAGAVASDSGGAVSSVAGRTGVVTLAKGDVGLGNVDNTTDANKPISSAQALVNADKADLVAGVIPAAQIPAIAVTEYLGSAANQAAMLALTGQKGDWVTRADLGTNWVISGDDPTQLASWTALSYPASPVNSVAGRTGVVTLAKADVGLGNVDNTSDANKPVSTAQALANSAVRNALAADYVISKDGSNVRATARGNLGLNDYVGTDSSVVIQSAITALTPQGQGDGSGGGHIHINRGLYFLGDELLINGWEGGSNPHSQLKITGDGPSSVLVQNNAGKNGLVVKNCASIVLRDFRIYSGGSAKSALLLDSNGAVSEMSTYKSMIDNLILDSNSSSSPAAYFKNFFDLSIGMLHAWNPANYGIVVENASTTTNYGNSRWGFISAVGASYAPYAGLEFRTTGANHFINLMSIGHYECVSSGYYGIRSVGLHYSQFGFVDIEDSAFCVMFDGTSSGEYSETRSVSILDGYLQSQSANAAITNTLYTGGNKVRASVGVSGTAKPIVDQSQYRTRNVYDLSVAGTTESARSAITEPTTPITWRYGNGDIVVVPDVKLTVVAYSGSLTVARPTAPAVYWTGFPSAPTNAQAQDIVAAAPSPKIVQEYIGAQTLNAQAFPLSGGKTPTSVTVDVLISAGTGGGSGRRGAAGTVRGGGGGGSGGGWARGVIIPASQFGTTWSLQMSAAGAGGAAVTTDNTDGNAGSVGGTNLAQFFTGDVNVITNGGDTGKGGTATGGAGGAYGGAGIGGQGSAGQSASATGGAGVAATYYGSTGSAGGTSGGGITAADVPSNGNDGSYNPYYNANKKGTMGLTGGALPTTGTAIAGQMGASGGSGAASKTAAAQAGAASAGYGAGGSGGGASLNGFASGAGGAGGPAFCRLIWDYS